MKVSSNPLITAVWGNKSWNKKDVGQSLQRVQKGAEKANEGWVRDDQNDIALPALNKTPNQAADQKVNAAQGFGKGTPFPAWPGVGFYLDVQPPLALMMKVFFVLALR